MIRILAGLLLSALLSPVWAFDHQHAAWSALLSRHVSWSAQNTASAVDYDGFLDDRTGLAAYLGGVAAVTRRVGRHPSAGRS